MQQRDRAARKAFGGAERRRERQLEYEVRAAPDRRFCAGVLVEHGEVAALHEISAHHADDDGVTAETFARAADVKHVAAVKRIVFRDNAADRKSSIHYKSEKPPVKSYIQRISRGSAKTAHICAP